MVSTLRGTVTFACAESTTITRSARRSSTGAPDAPPEIQRAVRATFANLGGQEVRADGPGLFAAFATPVDAVAAAVAAQRALMLSPGRAVGRPAVRIGLYTLDATDGSLPPPALGFRPAARVCGAAHGGQILMPESTWEWLDDLPPGVVVRDLGHHRLRDLQHVEHLFQVTHPDLAADFPPPKSLDTVPNNLPMQLTSFVGRGREMANITQLLARTRLLTLTGLGGSGKTRLAIHSAAVMLDGYPDGVWAVDLGPLGEASLVAQTVAAALGVPEQPDRTLVDTLVDGLRSKTILLLLDNCEHLAPACAQLVTTLLQRCPTLQVLATSQEALRVAGEVTYSVPSLSLPPSRQAPSLEALGEYEAVRLFADRAALGQPGFALTATNASAVLEICRRLDGVPLALELAAARLNVLTVEQVAERLSDRFRLLSEGSRTTLPRHHRLRAVMDWSYDLLSAPEQALLRRLSVFAGGWSLEAAESICSGSGLETPAILDLLGRLVERSLAVAETHDGEMRYRLLETVRQYSRDRLVEQGEAGEFRTRHARWYFRLAEQGDHELRGPAQITWLKRLEAEHENFRTALDWSRGDAGDPDTAVRLSAALYWFWFIHGHWSEGRGWLEGAMALTPASAEATMPKILLGGGHLARQQGDYQQAATWLGRGLTMAEDLGQVSLVPWFLINLGLVALYRGDAANAMSVFEQSLAQSRALGDRWLISMSLAQLGGAVATASRDYEQAFALLTESLAASRDAGDRYRIAFALRGLGTIALRRRDYEGAAARYRESLGLSTEVREGWVTEECLVGLAGVATALGYCQRAAQLLGAAEALREVLGLHRLAADEADYAERRTALQDALGEDVLRKAWAEGRAMSVDQAVALAVAPLEAADAGTSSTVRQEKRGAVERLTRRERDVAALVARGHTNREIATQLVISERTADTHVQNILNKLGFNSRAQIAAWAAEQGLLKAARG